MNNKISNTNKQLFKEIKTLIEKTRSNISQTVNSGLTMLYWNIGKRINNEILKNKRADYGKQIVITLSEKLTKEYGKGWSEKHLRHCLHFVETFPKFENLQQLVGETPWGHNIAIISKCKSIGTAR